MDIWHTAGQCNVSWRLMVGGDRFICRGIVMTGQGHRPLASLARSSNFNDTSFQHCQEHGQVAGKSSIAYLFVSAK